LPRQFLIWLLSLGVCWELFQCLVPECLRVFTNLLTTSSSAIMSKHSGRYQTYMYIDLLIDVDNVVRFALFVLSFVRLHLSMLSQSGHLSIGLSISINASVFSRLCLNLLVLFKSEFESQLFISPIVFFSGFRFRFISTKVT
jgi:hypothetical protein